MGRPHSWQALVPPCTNCNNVSGTTITRKSLRKQRKRRFTKAIYKGSTQRVTDEYVKINFTAALENEPFII